MTIQEITDNSDKIFECAKAFRKDANKLMLEMSLTFGFNLETLDGLTRSVYRRNHKNKGVLNEKWMYYFHGAECRFDNIETGQVVEIIYTQKPEFGYLDGFFFYNYMVTTERFKDLAHWFESYLNVYDAIDTLLEKGVFTAVPLLHTNRNVLAL